MLRLLYVPEADKTLQMCQEAVEQNGLQLRYVPDKWKQELSLSAVKQSKWALQYVPDKTPNICLAAVTSDGSALQYVP